jgi:hypothetical protein
MDAAVQVAKQMLEQPIAVTAKTQHALRTEKKEQEADKKRKQRGMGRAPTQKTGNPEHADGEPQEQEAGRKRKRIGVGRAPTKKTRSPQCADGEPLVGGSGDRAAQTSSGSGGAGGDSGSSPWNMMQSLHGDLIKQLPTTAHPDPVSVKGNHSYTLTRPGSSGRCTVLSDTQRQHAYESSDAA